MLKGTFTQSFRHAALALSCSVLGSAALLAPRTATAQPDAGLVAGQPPVRFDGQKVVTVTVTSVKELLAVTSLAESVWTHSLGVGPIDVQVTPAQLDAIRAMNLAVRVKIDDVQALIDAEAADIRARRAQRDLTWFQNYKTLAEINTYLTQLTAANPATVSSFTIGNSLLGKPVNGIRITGPDLPGNPKNARPQLMFNGCQHAREWISPMTVMFFADQLIAGYGTDQRITDILNNAEIILIPIVNPDGYDYTWTTNRLWRKNRRTNGDGSFGVDPNRNWGYQWGGEGASTLPSDETYRGPSAFSEPETQHLRDFVLANPRMRASIDFHSYSQLILSPWGWTSALPPDAAIFDQLNSDIRSAIASVNGLFYTAGPIYTTIYPASGGACDWNYGVGTTPRKILGLSIELRDTGANGFTLPADQIVPTGRENLAGILTLSESVAFPVKFTFPDGLPASASAGGTTTFRVNVVASPGSVLAAGTPKVYTRASSSGVFTPASLALVSGTTYTATLPASACGSDLQFYFEAQTTAPATGRSPASAPTAYYTTPVRQTIVKYNDPCEVSTGWVVGAAGDAATAGIWELAAPQATAAQPGSDHSTVGTKCWITGAAAGSSVGANDVDGGATTLTSPTFDATTPAGYATGEAYVEYWRWYSNDQGSAPNADSMPVQISNNNGSTWTQIELVTDNANAWVNKRFRISDFVTPTASMKLRFIARDLGSGSIVEAGVDDVLATVVACPCQPADFNCDGFITGEDFDAFVEAFTAGDLAADFDGDGFVTGEDFDAYVVAFENG